MPHVPSLFGVSSNPKLTTSDPAIRNGTNQVLDRGITSYESDVYSFGMVVLEILTREVPWSTAVNAQEIFRRVVIKRERPDIPADAPAELADIARACWASEPSVRPQFSSILRSTRSPESK